MRNYFSDNALSILLIPALISAHQSDCLVCRQFQRCCIAGSEWPRPTPGTLSAPLGLQYGVPTFSLEKLCHIHGATTLFLNKLCRDTNSAAHLLLPYRRLEDVAVVARLQRQECLRN